jgi:endoglucanase
MSPLFLSSLPLFPSVQNIGSHLKPGMKTPLSTALLSALLVSCHFAPAGDAAAGGGAIRVNTIGFLPGAEKRATIAAPPGGAGGIRVVRVADGATAFAAPAGAPVVSGKKDTDETVRVFDFTALDAPGDYRIEIPGGRTSAPFRIAGDVWDEPFAVAMRAFYLWRCGTAVRVRHGGRVFKHGRCHAHDAILDGLHRDAAGGWHDAGDYNKYTVNACFATGLLLKAWEQNTAALAAVNLGIPESRNATPDFLDEIRWELEWLLKMQEPGGGVYHKISERDFRYWGPPDEDASPRYHAGWSTAATAQFAAALAAAARAFRAFDADFADRCQAAAKRAAAVLAAHPEEVRPDQRGFKTGAYELHNTAHRLWAAVELWETTGDAACLRDFETRAARADFDFGGPSWGNVTDLALGAYLLASRRDARDPELVARLEKQLLEMAARIVASAEGNPHGRPLGGEAWFWGGNGGVAAQTHLLHLADRLAAAGRLPADPRRRQAAQHALAFLFGRNYHARSYVTGLGHNPPAHPHDRRGEPAWPGCLVGGAHPTGRDWKDDKDDYAQNEIAINWNAALVHALAPFVTNPKNASAK